MMKELSMTKENLSRGVESKMGELTILRNEVAELGDEVEENERKKGEIGEEIKALQAQV